MGGVVGAIFGAPEMPDMPEPEESKVDPNREAQLREAALRRRSILKRRGRQSLISRGGTSRGGVSVSPTKPATGGTSGGA